MLEDSLKVSQDILFDSMFNSSSDSLLIIVEKLAVAILIGLLIGLEREYSQSKEEKIFAGIRTFPLIAILGFVAALFSSYTSHWIYMAFFLGFAALIISSYIVSAINGKHGGTSEVTSLLVFILGSLIFWNLIILSAIIAVVTATFLSLKFQLHSFVGKINAKDLYATLKFAIITVIILPLLPDKTYGPFDVLNPRFIWYMVVFISGISFIGYILIKVLGQNKGIPFVSLLGGMVSSTALTFLLSKKSKQIKELSKNYSVGIIIASTMMYLRIFLITFILNNTLIARLWFPFLMFALTGIVISYFLWKKFNSPIQQNIEFGNPLELKSALIFGLAFAIIIFISKVADFYLGVGGIYAASVLGGFTSVDAIVVSLAELAQSKLAVDFAFMGIILATISNNFIKIIITLIFGEKEFQKITIFGLGILIIVSAVYLII